MKFPLLLFRKHTLKKTPHTAITKSISLTSLHIWFLFIYLFYAQCLLNKVEVIRENKENKE